MILALILLGTTFTYAQDHNSMSGNTLTMRDVPPVWPGCDAQEDDIAQLRACFKKKLAQHIGQNYKIPAGEKKGGRVVVKFCITEEGKPKIISITGGSKKLQAAAKKIFLDIPTMVKPGRSGGKAKVMEYTVPVTYKI